MHIISAYITLSALSVSIYGEKFNVDSLEEYTHFLNFGEKKIAKIDKEKLENSLFKSKVDVLGEVFKKSLEEIKTLDKLDIVFLVDASSSVGEHNFYSEVKFVRKVLSDVTVDYNHTRVAVVTYSSPSKITKHVDEISYKLAEHNKCNLFNHDLNRIKYRGGETYTLGALKTARDIFNASDRLDSKKVIFLITDGYSNGGNPIPVANELKSKLITIFTIGIRNGNYKELYEVSSNPGYYYSYLLDSFAEFENLARRALHVDLISGNLVYFNDSKHCHSLCGSDDCCDSKARCSCGTTTGHYACLCQSGYHGSGLKNSCIPCETGFYSDGPNVCLPCPDPNHVTKERAIGVESCKCKVGYSETVNNGCQERKCANFRIPDNAYLLNIEECTNSVNASCEIRCNAGFILKGNNSRICLENGSWSDEDAICQGLYCEALDTPKDGKVACIHPDSGQSFNSSERMLVDTECNFDCQNGKILIGSRRRTCLPSFKWNGMDTLCKHLKCDRLPTINHGIVKPISCHHGKQDVGKICTVECDRGYKSKGVIELKCMGGYGSWNANYENIVCFDVEPPKIRCPDNVEGTTLPGLKFGTVFWPEPDITDNSDSNISVWIKPAVEDVSKFKFKIGITTVTYYAQDAFQNRVKCTFNVSIEDKEAPVIEDCVDPPPFLVPDHDGADISWDEPYIYDNSQHVTVNKSHEFGYFTVGTTVVEYTATDAFGNSNSCQINITVEVSKCEAMPDPSNGQSDCIHEDKGIECLITCEDGYAIPIGQTDGGEGNNFICKNSDPFWFAEEDNLYVDCTVTKVPTNFDEDGEIEIDVNPEDCNNPIKLKELENEISNSLQSSLCVEDCSIVTELSECDIERIEEDSNKILTKRETIYEEVPHKNNKKRQKGRMNVKFQVRGKFLNNATINIDSNIRSQSGYNITVRRTARKFICPRGFIPRKHRCVQCPKGTFHNVTRNKCQSCPLGFYNDRLGQNMCISCPIHYSTRRIHSKKSNDCKEQCPPGTHARKKRIKYPKDRIRLPLEKPTLRPYCHSCAVGYYQSDYGQLTCKQCPSGSTTLTVASINQSQCILTAKEICKNNVCGIGVCVISDEYQYSCDCPKNYIGTFCEKQVSHCDSQPCLNGGSCRPIAAGFSCICKSGFSGKYCQEAISDSRRQCLNDDIVYEDKGKLMCLCQQGYTGVNCETKISYCIKNVCMHNSTCLDEDGSFRCKCIDGYVGRRCNLLPCDYKPCGKYRICTNHVDVLTGRGYHMCSCPQGFKGEECSERINLCNSLPCLNGGTCISGLRKYSCLCDVLYHGNNCQHKRETKYILHFQKYDIGNYVRLNGFSKKITEITTCLWMHTLDNFNYGTLFSYATTHKDNAFALTDYTGLVIYVNNNYVVTDISLNDGLWHHVCTTWRSLKGLYAVFVDGNLVKSGTNLSSGTPIQGGGSMIIGQDQDAFGGKFSQSESFVGQMTYIDMWSRALSSAEILKHFSDCNDSFFGDLYAWPIMQDHIKGGVKVTESMFCKKCEMPSPLYNGFIKILNDKAHYSCYEGYQLNSARFANGRKCTKASRWEGNYEPYCKRVNCGYPGYIRHGYPLGNRFFYKDRITYLCYDGFTLSGNSTITCEKDGKWTEKPKCLGLQCPPFLKPNNSELDIHSDRSYEDFKDNSTQFDTGTQIEFTCNPTANLSGESLITCLENGTWDYQLPKCIMKEPVLGCPMNKIPLPPKNGSIVEESLIAAGNATTNYVVYKCDKGFKQTGINITTCIIDGYWTVPNISCEAITCTKPQLPKNVILDDELKMKNSYNIGKSIKFECEDGYSSVGNSAIRCLRNGKWSKMQGKCIKKSCRKPNVKSTTSVQGKSYLYDDKVQITCSSGTTYELHCNKHGVWEGNRDDTC